VDNNYFFIPLSFLILGVSCWGLYRYWKKDPNSIIVGVSTDYPPFSYKANGKLTGFEVDLVKMVVDKLGKKLVFKEMEFPSLISSLRSGRVDIVASGVSPTEMRLQSVDFSEPYHDDHYSVVLRDKKIQSLSDLKGLQAGVQTGSVVESLVRKWSLDHGFKVVSYNLNTQILQSLKAGHLQALFIAGAEGKAVAKENEDLVCRVFGDLGEKSEGVAMAFQRFSPLTAQVNVILQELKQDGTIEQLKQKYGLSVATADDRASVVESTDDLELDDQEESVAAEGREDSDFEVQAEVADLGEIDNAFELESNRTLDGEDALESDDSASDKIFLSGDEVREEDESDDE
jgi:polar amino acid transport system substrate-binding protein